MVQFARANGNKVEIYAQHVVDTNEVEIVPLSNEEREEVERAMEEYAENAENVWRVAENVGNALGNAENHVAENAGGVVENAGNVNLGNVVAENDGQVAHNVNVGNVAIQGQNAENDRQVWLLNSKDRFCNKCKNSGTNLIECFIK